MNKNRINRSSFIQYLKTLTLVVLLKKNTNSVESLTDPQKCPLSSLNQLIDFSHLRSSTLRTKFKMFTKSNLKLKSYKKKFSSA